MADAGGIRHSYRAFISYSHADARAVARLHRDLERFTVPKELVGREGLFGPVPSRIAPIFRDRDELPASGSLSARLEEALRDSMFLVVACSPSAAQSRWVGKETESYLRIHGPDRILAIIVGGEADLPLEALFPPALAALSPIAADARPEKDGERSAFLKVAAGLLGVGLDDLVQRDAQQRLRRAGLLAGGSVALAAGMAALALVAVNAQREAERQRDAAESLIEFMLTDLRGRLEPVGRLDVLDSVGERALAHYQAQSKGARDPEMLGRRSRALILIGEVANLRGASDESLIAFREAAATTRALMDANPVDGDRIYDHNTATFWVGYVAWQRRDIPSARQAFEENLALTTKLVALEPGNMDWRREHALSHTNLGVLALDEGRPAAALPLLQEGRRITLTVAPQDRDLQRDAANTDGWIANAMYRLGRLKAAEEVRRRQIAFNRNLDPDGRDLPVQEQIAVAHHQLAQIAMSRGDAQAARALATDARAIWARLRAADPANAFWRQQAMQNASTTARLLVESGEIAEGRAMSSQAVAEALEIHRMDPRNREWLWTSVVTALANAARVPRENVDAERQLLAEIDRLLAYPPTPDKDRSERMGRAQLWAARARLVAAPERRAAWMQAEQLLTPLSAEADPPARLLHATVLYCVGQPEGARRLLGLLAQTEFRTAEMARLARDLATGRRDSCGPGS